MEGLELDKLGLFLKKNKRILLILFAGLLLMLLPVKRTEKPSSVTPTTIQKEKDLQDSLAEILSGIEGAGKVKVLLTQSEGEETFYQTDENLLQDQESLDRRLDTIIVTDGQRAQTGLIRRIDPPVYQGAVVLCQGADSATIRLAVVDAVAKATGLTSNHISVLKMK